MKKKSLYLLIMLSLFGISLILMILSKLEATLLAVAFGLILIPLAMLTVFAFKSYKQTNRDLKNIAFEELLESEESEDQFEDVQLPNKKTKTHNDKLGFVVICVIATVLCAFMFIKLL